MGVAAILALRAETRQAPAAVRVDSAAGLSAAPAPRPPPLEAEAAPAAVSLTELARELQAGRTTSTTRPRTTSTTTARKPAATTTTSKPATTTTKKPAPPPPTPSTTAAPLTPLTTLVETVVPPAAAVSAAVTRSDSGVASWFNAPDATCAHRTLPMGTIVKVTRIHNGASTTCKVSDRGPTVATGRLIDLSLDTFEKLAAREAGLIDVRIEW